MRNTQGNRLLRFHNPPRHRSRMAECYEGTAGVRHELSLKVVKNCTLLVRNYILKLFIIQHQHSTRQQDA